MTQQQINSLNMFKAVTALLEKKSDVWSTRTPIVPVVLNLKSIVSGVELYMKSQFEKGTAGYTQQKDAKLDVLLKLVYKLSAKLRAYAKATENIVLLKAVDYSASSLESGTETEIISRCQTIAKKANEFLSQLTDYEVTPAELDFIDHAIKDVEPLASQRDAVASERKAATAGIPELIRKGKDQLDVLDDLIEGLIHDDNFIDSYFNARRIIDRSTVGATTARKE
jgi:hypothetical protein